MAKTTLRGELKKQLGWLIFGFPKKKKGGSGHGAIHIHYHFCRKKPRSHNSKRG